MRILANITNVDAPSTNYPSGRIRNKNTSTDPITRGTPVVEEIYGDQIQFFQKLMSLAGLTANDLPDNVENGYQLIEALRAFLAARDGNLITEVCEIGDWNMFTTDFITIEKPGRYLDRIKAVEVLIRDDSNTRVESLFGASGFNEANGYWYAQYFPSENVTRIYLSRNSAKFSTLHSSTSYNRGFITIKLTPTT